MTNSMPQALAVALPPQICATSESRKTMGKALAKAVTGSRRRATPMAPSTSAGAATASQPERTAPVKRLLRSASADHLKASDTGR